MITSAASPVFSTVTDLPERLVIVNPSWNSPVIVIDFAAPAGIVMLLASPSNVILVSPFNTFAIISSWISFCSGVFGCTSGRGSSPSPILGNACPLAIIQSNFGSLSASLKKSSVTQSTPVIFLNFITLSISAKAFAHPALRIMLSN